MIDGIKITPLKQIVDEKGKIMHMIRNDSKIFEKFGEFYFSTVNPGFVKAWHLHKENTLNYVCIKGKVKLVLLDDRKDSSTYGKKESFTLNSETGNALFIPRGIYHAFVTLTDNTKCLAISNRPFDQKNPDVYKIPISKIMQLDYLLIGKVQEVSSVRN